MWNRSHCSSLLTVNFQAITSTPKFYVCHFRCRCHLSNECRKCCHRYPSFLLYVYVGLFAPKLRTPPKYLWTSRYFSSPPCLSQNLCAVGKLQLRRIDGSTVYWKQLVIRQNLSFCDFYSLVTFVSVKIMWLWWNNTKRRWFEAVQGVDHLFCQCTSIPKPQRNITFLKKSATFLKQFRWIVLSKTSKVGML